MDTIFEAIFFLDVGLLGITITLFVLAVSLLGRAIKLSLQEQEETEEKAKKEVDDEIKKIKSQLNKTASSSHPDLVGLNTNLALLVRKQKEHQYKLNNIKNKPSHLKVSGGVILPGIFFIISLVFCIFARYNFSINSDTNMLGYYFGAIVPVVIGLTFVYSTLKVVEEVAITSEDTAFIREAEVLKTALFEFEEAKRPILELRFKNEKPPIHFGIEQTKTITVGLVLLYGESARNPVIGIGIPNDFSFSEKQGSSQPVSSSRSNYVFSSISCDTCLQGIVHEKNVIITAPKEKGKYKSYWTIFGENIYPEEAEIIFIVE